MIKWVSILLFSVAVAWAGLPPTTSKLSSDSLNVTTFNYQFPNFTGTHTGVTVSLGVNGVVGGGTGLSSDSAYSLLVGGTTSTSPFQQVSGTGSSGQVLTSNGASALPTWQAAGAPSFSGLTQYGAIYAGSSTSVLSTAAGTVGYPLVANSSAAPTFQILGQPGGGSGLSSSVPYAIFAGGTTATAAHQQIATGSSTGVPLLSNGSGALASFGAINLGSTTAVTGIGTVSNGMTGVNSLTPYAIIAGGTTSTAAVQQIAAGATTGALLQWNGANALPTWVAPYFAGAQSWSGYFPSSYYWSTTSTTFADFTFHAGSGGISSRFNNGFGTVTAAASNLPGFTWTPTALGPYLICTAGNVGWLGSGYVQAGIQLVDGSGTVINASGSTDSNSAGLVGGFGFCGLYNVTSLSSTTIKIQGAAQNSTGFGMGGNYITQPPVEFSIAYLGGSVPRCQSTYDSGNGAGSTNTKVRRWSNSRVATGSCYTYADSATLGGSWTINTQGVYTACYADTSSTTGTQIAIVVNGTAGTTNPASLTYAQGLRMQGNTGAATVTQHVCWTGNLNVNDVVWAQEDGGANSTTATSMFTLTQVSN